MAVVESFELTEHIAACGSTTVGTGNAFGKPNHYGASNCQFISNDGMTIMFSSGTVTSEGEGCDWDLSVDKDGHLEDFQGACYNTPDGIISMFAS